MKQEELQNLLDELRTLIRWHDWNYRFSPNRKHVMKSMAVEKLIYEKALQLPQKEIDQLWKQVRFGFPKPDKSLWQDEP